MSAAGHALGARRVGLQGRQPGAQAEEGRLGVEVAADVGEACGQLGGARGVAPGQAVLDPAPGAHLVAPPVGDQGGLVAVLRIVLREGLAQDLQRVVGAARANQRAGEPAARGRDPLGQVPPQHGQEPVQGERGLGGALLGQQVGDVRLEGGHLHLGEARPLGAGRADPAEMDLVAGLGQHDRQGAPGAAQRPVAGRGQGRHRAEVGHRRGDPRTVGLEAREAPLHLREQRRLVVRPRRRGVDAPHRDGRPLGVLHRHRHHLAGRDAGRQGQARHEAEHRQRGEIRLQVEAARGRLLPGDDRRQLHPGQGLGEAGEPAVHELDHARIVTGRAPHGGRGVARARGAARLEQAPQLVRARGAVGEEGEHGIGNAPHPAEDSGGLGRGSPRALP